MKMIYGAHIILLKILSFSVSFFFEEFAFEALQAVVKDPLQDRDPTGWETGTPEFPPPIPGFFISIRYVSKFFSTLKFFQFQIVGIG